MDKMKESGRLHLDTEALRERDRFPVFCEEFFRRYVALDIVKQEAMPFRGVIDLRSAGVVGIGKVDSTPADYVRTRALLRDGNDALGVTLCRQGSFHSTQSREGCRVEPGQGVIFDNTEIGGIHTQTRVRSWSLSVPRSRLAGLVPHLGSFAGAKLNDGDMALRLLFAYLDATEDHDLGSGRASELFGDHIVDLVALALGANGEARMFARGRGLKAARLRELLASIARHCCDPAFDVDAAARRLGISRRYVQSLLEETGRSFTEHLAERRLQRALAMLKRPLSPHLRIIDIALAVGFGDVSHFNRMFRRRFGASPSDVRAAAERANQEHVPFRSNPDEH